MSFTHPAYVRPPGMSDEEAAGAWAGLLPMHEHMRRVFLRAHDEDALTWSRERQDAFLRQHAHFVHDVYLGFENGLYLNFPGYGPKSPDTTRARAHGTGAPCSAAGRSGGRPSRMPRAR